MFSRALEGVVRQRPLIERNCQGYTGRPEYEAGKYGGSNRT